MAGAAVRSRSGRHREIPRITRTKFGASSTRASTSSTKRGSHEKPSVHFDLVGYFRDHAGTGRRALRGDRRRYQFNMRDGIPFLEFDRTATLLQDAIRSAIGQVKGAGLGLRVVRVESDAANLIAKINTELLGVTSGRQMREPALAADAWTKPPQVSVWRRERLSGRRGKIVTPNDNPSQPPERDRGGSMPGSAKSSLPSALRFRGHFVAAPIVGLCLTGHPIAVATIPLDSLWVVFAVEFGLWVHPLNVLGSLLVFATIPLMQAIKWARPGQHARLRMAQIGLWWAFWLVFGLALCFGEYRGP